MSNRNPWLSILVPVFNVQAYVGACVQSVFSQLVPGVEIVLLDDASTDGSAAVLFALAERFGPSVRVIQHPVNRGVAAARNSLVAAARGDYLWFVDPDDLMCAGAVARLKGITDSMEPDVVLCDFNVLRERSSFRHRLRGERHRRTFIGPSLQLSADKSTLVSGLLSAGQLHAWSKIAKARVWRATQFPEGRYFEDIAVIADFVAATGSFIYVPEPWIAYRQHDASILATYSARKVRDQIAALVDLHHGLNAQRVTGEDARFALDHFCLKAHASLARRLAKPALGDTGELRMECRASLNAIFPEGIDDILRRYMRRGWLLRARRARQSLQRMGMA